VFLIWGSGKGISEEHRKESFKGCYFTNFNKMGVTRKKTHYIESNVVFTNNAQKGNTFYGGEKGKTQKPKGIVQRSIDSTA